MAEQQAPTGDPERTGAAAGSSGESDVPSSDAPPSSWADVLDSVGLGHKSPDPDPSPQSPPQESQPEADETPSGAPEAGGTPSGPPEAGGTPSGSPESAASPSGPPQGAATPSGLPAGPPTTSGPSQGPPSPGPPTPPSTPNGGMRSQTTSPQGPGPAPQTHAQSPVPVLHPAGSPGPPAPQVPGAAPQQAGDVRPDFTYLPYGAGAAPWSGSDEEWQPGPDEPAPSPDRSTASRRPLLVFALVAILLLLLLGIALAVWRIIAGLDDPETSQPSGPTPFVSSGGSGSDLTSALKEEGFTCSLVTAQPTVQTCFSGGGPVGEPLQQYAWRVSIQTDDSDVVQRIDGSSQSDAGGPVVQRGWTTIVNAAAATVFSDDADAFRSAVSSEGPMEFGDWSGGVQYNTPSEHSFSFSRNELTSGFTPGPALQAPAADIEARALNWGFSCPPTHSGVSCRRASRNGVFQIDTTTYRGQTNKAAITASTPFGGRLNEHAAQEFLTRSTELMIGSNAANGWLRGKLDGGVYSAAFDGYLLELNPSNYGAGRNFILVITGFDW
jgi:hypothetical protein